MRLKTFGRVHILGANGKEVALQPLPLAVLVYLAVGGPRDRDHLAGMFWPNGKNRLNSLSTTLNRIRTQVPGGVWVEGTTVVGTDLVSDICELRDALDRSDFTTVARLYDAAFLGSLKLRQQSLEFEDWVIEQRATSAAMVELALLHRGRSLFDAGEHREAAAAVEDAWEIAIRDGFPSPDYFETYHRILASAARPSANAVRAMAGEIGIMLPPVEPGRIAVAIRSSDPSTPVPTSHSGDRRPVTDGTAPIFGCEKELTAIASSVASQPVTTVVGLGGSGKERLAAEFFNSAAAESHFPHRYWVSLRDVSDQDLVGPAIAASLGQRYDSLDSLADWLPDDQPVLLVLDNFEQVVQSAGIAEELTHRNSAVRILVTSRVPLELPTEALVNLTGLDTSDDDDVDSPAEQLFVASARRAGVSSDRLGGESKETIREVCRRVGGNPLALEIAGGWAQILSPDEILDALSLDRDLLGSPMLGGLRSMDEVLNQSCATRGETEQHTLMLLATFSGGCLTTEALKLDELPIRSIGRLGRRSLARLTSKVASRFIR